MTITMHASQRSPCRKLCRPGRSLGIAGKDSRWRKRLEEPPARARPSSESESFGKMFRILDIALSPSRRMRRLVALFDHSGMQTAQANDGGSCDGRKAQMQLRIDFSSLARASIGVSVQRRRDFRGIVRIEEPRIIGRRTFGRNGVGRMDQRSSGSDLQRPAASFAATERESGEDRSISLSRGRSLYGLRSKPPQPQALRPEGYRRWRRRGLSLHHQNTTLSRSPRGSRRAYEAFRRPLAS